MNPKIFQNWLKLNLLVFATAFIVAMLLYLAFPETMLAFVRGWGAYSIAVDPTVVDTGTKQALFINILTKNVLIIILYVIASLLLLAPVLAVITGTFYALGLLSALNRGLMPLWLSPLLITIEVSFILLTLTIGSAIGSEMFGVQPGLKTLKEFWKQNWKRLFPEPKRNWREVFKENKKVLAAVTGVIVSLILIGAWVEAFL
jgi:hypothetical protein